MVHWKARHYIFKIRCMAKLYFYYSAMNAGKTTVLLQSAHNYRERGMNPLLFTPALDDRYRSGVIRSRIGLESDAVMFGAGDDLLGRVEVAVDGLADDLAQRLAGERRPARHHVVERRAAAEQVGARGRVRAAADLLRRHVLRRADGQSGFGEPCAPRLAHGQRDAEVRHLGLALDQEDVLGLDVPVDHPLAVGVVERPGDGTGEFHRLVDAELLLAVQLGPERLALDVGHDVEQHAAGVPGVVEREDVRMAEPRGDLDLAEKALAADGRGQVGVHDLERHPAVVAKIVREVGDAFEQELRESAEGYVQKIRLYLE